MPDALPDKIIRNTQACSSDQWLAQRNFDFDQGREPPIIRQPTLPLEPQLPF